MSDFDRRPRVFCLECNKREYRCCLGGQVIERNIDPAWIDYRVAMLHFQEIDAWVDGVMQQAPRRKPFKELVLELSDAVGLPRKPVLTDLW